MNPPIPIDMPDSGDSASLKPDRAAWEKRLADEMARRRDIKAAYAAHMTKASQHLYAAGECVKNGEFGSAQAQHRIADLHLAAARKLLPEI